MKAFKLLPLLFAPWLALADHATADLALQLDIDVSEGVQFGEIGEFTLTVTNLGPDDAGSHNIGRFPTAVFTPPQAVNEHGLLDVYLAGDNSTSQPCGVGLIVIDPIPGNPVLYGQPIYFPEIQANSTLTCHGLFLIGFDQGERSTNFRLRGDVNDTDPDSSNNEIKVVFGIPPVVVPINSLALLLSLFPLLLLTAFMRIRHA